MKSLKKILALSIVSIIIGTSLTLAGTIEPPIVNPPKASQVLEEYPNQLLLGPPIVDWDF